MFTAIERLVAKTTIRAMGRLVTYHYLPETTDSEIKGIFDNAFIETQRVSTTSPIITFYDGDLTRAPSVADKVTINSVLYRIIDIRPDGVSGIVLVLQED